MHACAGQGRETVIRRMIQMGADIDPKTEFGRTPLMLAAMNGRVRVVELLIEKGADIHAKDSAQATAVVGAAYNDHRRTVQLSKTRAISHSCRSRTSPLYRPKHTNSRKSTLKIGFS
jgi:ankyrin repeat protein